MDCKNKQTKHFFKKKLHGISGARGLGSLFAEKIIHRNTEMIKNRKKVLKSLAMELNGTCAIIHFSSYLYQNYGFFFY